MSGSSLKTARNNIKNGMEMGIQAGAEMLSGCCQDIDASLPT
jgi:hypothetical protein